MNQTLTDPGEGPHFSENEAVPGLGPTGARFLPVRHGGYLADLVMEVGSRPHVTAALPMVGLCGAGGASSRGGSLSNFALQPTSGAGGILAGAVQVNQVPQRPASVVAGAAAAEGDR